MAEFSSLELQHFIEVDPSLSDLLGQVICAKGGKEQDKDVFDPISSVRPSNSPDRHQKLIDSALTVGAMLRVARILFEVEKEIEDSPDLPLQVAIRK